MPSEIFANHWLPYLPLFDFNWVTTHLPEAQTCVSLGRQQEPHVHCGWSSCQFAAHEEQPQLVQVMVAAASENKQQLLKPSKFHLMMAACDVTSLFPAWMKELLAHCTMWNFQLPLD